MLQRYNVHYWTIRPSGGLALFDPLDPPCELASSGIRAPLFNHKSWNHKLIGKIL